MLYLNAENLELRGVANKTSKTGNLYYVMNVETQDGEHHEFYCPDSNVFPNSLKKGDKINVSFEVSYYKGNPKLTVARVEKEQ